MLEALGEFATWAMTHALGKIVVYGLFGLPILALLGFFSLSKRNKKDD